MSNKKATYKNVGYSLCNQLRKNDDRQEGWKAQRAERGFDNTELWNLDVTIAKFVLPRLKAAKEFYSVDPEIMDKMILAFEYAASDDLWCGPLPPAVTEGLQLFVDNYFALWI